MALKHGRPQHLFVASVERTMFPDIAWVGPVAAENGWRREHAARVWQAMQAVLAVVGAHEIGG